MLIGLYDYDFAQYGSRTFNLNLMKTSSYFKQKNDVVVLAPKLEPERYTKFFVFKDEKDNNFNKSIFDPNVTRLGLAFSSKYIPLIKEAEFIKPDNYIYSKVKNEFNPVLYSRMMRARHLRISSDGINIDNNYLKTIIRQPHDSIICLHDENLATIKDSHLLIKELMEDLEKSNKFKKFLYTKYPIVVNDEKELENWVGFNFAKDTYIQYNKIISDDYYNYLLENDDLKQVRTHLKYNPAASWSEENGKMVDELPKIFRQVLLSRSKLKPILLIYENDFFIQPLLNELFKKFYTYETQAVEFNRFGIPRIDYFSFLHYAKIFIEFKKNSRDEFEELFTFVRKNSYETFKMFYENGYATFKGGKIINE